MSRFSYGDGPEIRLDAQFQYIVADQRIVFSYRMAVGPQPMSASLTTVELTPSGDGTRLTYTEQGAFFDGVDSAKGREEGPAGCWRPLPPNFSGRSSPGCLRPRPRIMSCWWRSR
ncbi:MULTISPECIES: SRPBCC domain-containing protein [unclassified Mesorhizobium]|uniref:SRPBCC domain-containing protein n=1 Tax=Mesorhizobium TaxID=68287 RepID=UPI0004CEE8B0|nr:MULTISPECIES: SRPBCC domain-containing protein [unclassified Mesorhizobium]